VYRDDEEALRAQVASLEADLAAERRARQDTELQLRAVRRDAREAAARAREERPGPASRPKWMVSVGLLGCAVAVGTMLYAWSFQRRLESAKMSAAQTLQRSHQQLQSSAEKLKKEKALNAELGLRLRQAEDRAKQVRVQAELDAIASGKLPMPGVPRDRKTKSDMVNKMVELAQGAWASGAHHRAREIARAVLVIRPDDFYSLKIFAGSSCFLKDRAGVLEVWPKLNYANRQFVRTICGTSGITVGKEP